MTIKQYLAHRRGLCLKKDSLEKAPINYVVTYRIPVRKSTERGQPIDKKQRVWGYETLPEAKATAGNLRRWGGSHIRIHKIKKKGNQ